MWLVDREKKAVNKYSFHGGGGSSALQTPFSKGRICWSTFALQYSLLYTASKIFSSLTIRGKTKNFILFCWKARERDRTRQFLWLHIIVLCCAIRRLFRPRKLSLFDGKTIDDDYFATFDQRQKKTDSIIFTKKKNTIHNNMQWKSNVVVWLADFVNRFIWHNLKIMMQELTLHSFSIQFRQVLCYISKNEKNTILQEPT